MIRIGLAIAVAFAGCKSESARRANRAADEVIAQREDGVEAASGPAQVPIESAELTGAERELAARKRIRIELLRSQHSVIASQINAISAMAEQFRLTDAGRAGVTEKLAKLQIRLDEALNRIEALSGADAETWQERDDAVSEAMDTLDAARRAAWEALDDAPRIAPNAS